MSEEKKIKRNYKKLIILIWVVFVGGVLSVSTFIYTVNIDAMGLFGGLPSLKTLDRPDPDLSSELYSADGKSLGKYFRYNRTPVAYNELSQELIDALLVTEDLRYTKHAGIDLRGLGRVFFKTLLMGEDAGGGSTITQQLAKNLFKTRNLRGSLSGIPGLGILIIKIKEWIVAVKLERSYTKEEILAMYLNTVEYGANSYGIKVAAKTFFNKLPSDLNYKESAILVGLINAPTRYSPIRNPENATAKRTEVLYNLYKYKKIDKISFDSLKISDFGLQYKVANQNEGQATYFRSVIKNFLLNWSKENEVDLYADGLKIYTTIDSRMQEYAENAVKKHMDTLQGVFFDHLNGDKPWIDEEGKELDGFLENATKRTPYYRSLVKKYGEESDSVDFWMNLPRKMKVFSWQGEIDTTFSMLDSLAYYKHFLHAGFMAMDPKSGHIKAWVGGINHKYFKYDHVKQGRRQPGSTFKPFVYATAIEAGYSPCFPVQDLPVTWAMPGDDPPTWTPENSDGPYSGEKMTMRQAMARSINSITAYIMQKVSPSAVVKTAHDAGIQSRLSAVPALCLGAGGDVSVYEMVGAYSTFVNKGVWTEPFYITRIEDENGNVLQDFVPKRKEALSEKTAYLMTYMLRGGAEEEGGTARGLWMMKEGNEIGGKTGTTQNASDGWFMGITKDLVAGAWVGGDERPIHFKYWAMGQGARTAMPIYKNFMLDVYADPRLGIEKGPFNQPTFNLDVELDCSKYGDINTDSEDDEALDLDDVF
jgi:penicillin-binding protein 1A